MFRRATRATREDGYALVAAVTAVAAFAYVAFQALAAGQGSVAIVAARIEQAKLAAAADGGVYLAIQGLADSDRASRWSLAGRAHSMDFGDTRLTIEVVDERGKAPLVGLNDEQARALFQGAGATGERLDALVSEFREWQTQDTVSDQGPPTAEALAAPIRHGPFATVGELAGLKDMDPTLLAQIAPAVTTFFEESGPFEPSHATPLAIATMTAQGTDSPEALANLGEIARQTPDEEIAGEETLIGRTLTVQVEAQARDGAHTHRMAIIELTGDKARPYWIRYVE
jgi:general secretion pathway protein K